MLEFQVYREEKLKKQLSEKIKEILDLDEEIDDTKLTRIEKDILERIAVRYK